MLTVLLGGAAVVSHFEYSNEQQVATEYNNLLCAALTFDLYCMSCTQPRMCPYLRLLLIHMYIAQSIDAQ